jgi:hypothetical protein
MAYKRYSASSVALEDGQVVAAGGVMDANVLSTMEVYGPGLGIWVLSDPMPTPRANFGLEVIPGGRVVATGSWSTLGASNSTGSLCPCEFVWRAEDPMARARGMHGSAVTANGTVLAIGGWDGKAPMASVEMLVEVQQEEPSDDECEPMDLLPIVQAYSDEFPGYSENGLIAKIIVAQAAFDLGQTRLCLNLLDAFYNQVRAASQGPHLSGEGAAALYEGYAEIVACLGGEPLPPLP